MKVVLVCALIGVAVMAIDSETMSADIEGATELLQEHAKVEAQAKQGVQAHAKDTLTIWGKDVSMEKVQMAKKQLHAVMKKVGAKRPQILDTISTIQELTDRPELLGEGKLQGGYKKLRKVLWKIDQLEIELLDEHAQLTAQIAAIKKKCDDDFEEHTKTLADHESQLEIWSQENDRSRDVVKEKEDQIEHSMKEEVKASDELEDMKTQVKEKYDKFWLESDDRAAVRNVLMQAVWLVCYGFRKFRHDDFCTTLRKEPDFAESGVAQGKAEGAKYLENAKVSYKFSETMEEVWKQQKAADAHAVNTEDGDPDMEKGFVNNRAPWGVDPPSVDQSLIQEATGVDAKDVESDGTMSSQALASRLDFLLQSSNMPEKAAAPIQDLIEALQEDESEEPKKKEELGESSKAKAKSDGDEVPAWKKQWARYDTDENKKKTLVMIMVDIEKETGTDQQTADADWMQKINSYRNEDDTLMDTLKQHREEQKALHGEIASENDKQELFNRQITPRRRSADDLVVQMHDDMEICAITWMELDIERETNEEEQTNIKRLNSLLRFLALGDTPVCEEMSGEDEPCNAKRDRGQCTWSTRGTSEGGNGEAAEGEKTFCACEWGYYGENCEKVKCPGFGKVLYKDTDPGVCSDRGGSCDNTQCDDNGCDSDKGVCAKCHHKYHGYGAKVNKCQFKFCPMGMTNTDDIILPTNEEDMANQCSRHGQCDKRSGKCTCDADYWGKHCGYKKCRGSVNGGGSSVEAKFAGWSPSACNNRGECKQVEKDGELQGVCKCGPRHFGEACEWTKCSAVEGREDECQGRGTCKKETGQCMCNAPYKGAKCSDDGKECNSCIYKDCIGDCGGESNGQCDMVAGKCVCNVDAVGTLFNGALCKAPGRMLEYTADWTRSMDKWGWSVCKEDWLLTGLKRDGAGDALYNLAYGKCARPSEGGSASTQRALRLEHCYHENWWKKFDFKGGKFCRKNYFVAGLFRSHCNSLYCLEMAKCCQVQRSLWNNCKWESISSDFNDRNCKQGDGVMDCEWAEIKDSKSFIAGFYRSDKHTLDGLTYIRKCEPYFFGANCRPGESGAHCA